MTTTHRILQRLGQAWLWGLLLAFCGAALAQSQAQAQDGDPPGRVARLSEVNGQVWLYSPDAGDWVNAIRNQPLTTSDRLATDAGGRAELQIGSTTLRLDGSSEVEVLALDDAQVALQLHSGSAVARVRSADAARELSLSTTEGRFRIDQPGRYRFDRPQGDRAASAVTVYTGQATYEGDRTALAVAPGQRAEFWIDAAGAAQYSLAEPVRDAFVAWNDERDGRDAVSVSSRYVSPEMTGADDLDRYGSWDQSPEYGAVWTPRNVAADWAPYSSGHWAFVRPWGWTWVDDAPWGFAPFHYGRWVYAGRGWGWVPGVRVPRPVYAPALVAWVGGGRGDVSVSIGGGGPSVGWFPLAPRDVYVPGYRYSPRYVREVNIGNVRDARRIDEFVNTPAERRDFGNRRFPHALTVVPTSVVTGRQSVAQSAAQWRAGGGERGFGAGAALAAAPVGAPQPARVVDPRLVRPPGVPRAEAGGQRPGASRDVAGSRPRVGEAGAPRPTSRGDFVDGGRSLPEASPRTAAEPARRGDSREPPAARPAATADAQRPGSRTAPLGRPSEAEERRALPGSRGDVGLPAPRPPVRERGDEPRSGERRTAPQAALGEREERRALPGTTNDFRSSRARGDDRPSSNRDDAAAAPRYAPRAEGRPANLPQASTRPEPRNELRSESRNESPRAQRQAEAPRPPPGVRPPEQAQPQRARPEAPGADRHSPGGPRQQER